MVIVCPTSNRKKIFYKDQIPKHYTVKPVYKGYSREPENVPFMSSCPLYTG